MNTVTRIGKNLQKQLLQNQPLNLEEFGIRRKKDIFALLAWYEEDQTEDDTAWQHVFFSNKWAQVMSIGNMADKRVVPQAAQEEGTEEHG